MEKPRRRRRKRRTRRSESRERVSRDNQKPVFLRYSRGLENPENILFFGKSRNYDFRKNQLRT